uniref:Uncharacterized protein n=1 Tax=Pithovirus LCDPAC01 TaxID=2506600 RepID=A0A481YNG6_9VIRU|nr:MAG: hypothetical protein LCDPAC01_01370 [Pithovirus LCDPAC01]
MSNIGDTLNEKLFIEIIRLCTDKNNIYAAIKEKNNAKFISLARRWDYKKEQLFGKILKAKKKFNNNALKTFFYFVNVTNREKVLDRMLRLIRTHSGDTDLEIYISRIETVFGELTNDEILSIKQSGDYDSKGEGAKLLFKKLETRMIPEKKYAVIPAYIIGNKKTPDIKTLSRFTLETVIGVPKKDAIERVIKIMKKGGKEVDRKQLTKYVNDMSKNEYMAFGSQYLGINGIVLNYLITSKNLYLVYGPLNISESIDYTLMTTNTIYGGPRMFLDMSYEVDDQGENMNDWYTGKCEECENNIRSRRYAVRDPLLQGGWRGCFCSWECVEDRVRRFMNKEGVDIDRSDKHIERIRRIEKEMDKIGLLNKVPELAL